MAWTNRQYSDLLDVVRTTDAATEPVTLAEAKTHLRISGSAFDTEISALITAARTMAEEYCQRSFITQTWKLFLEDFPTDDLIRLPYGKLIGVTSVKYSNSTQLDTTLNASDYEVITNDIGFVYSEGGFPSSQYDFLRGVEIEYTAGYGANASDVPQLIKQGILVLIADLFEQRQSYVKGQMGHVGEGSPFSPRGEQMLYEVLLRPYVIRF